MQGRKVLIKSHHFLHPSTKRCIIPVKGFFEWQHIGNEKIPWYIYNADE